MDTKSGARKNYLDWLRVLAILFVLVYHSTRFFNLEDWEVKNPTRYPWVEIWNLFAWNWMMPLIFVISGASLFFAVGRGSAGKFVQDKVLRLLLPFLVAVFTHATLQVYLNWITHGLFSGSYFQFLPKYLAQVFGRAPWLFLFEVWDMHLWYLLWLFLDSLLLYPLLRWLKGRGGTVLAATGRFLARPGAVYLLALPTVLLLAFANPDRGLMAEAGGWSQVIYLWLLLCGFLLLSNPDLEAGIRRLRWPSLAAAAGMLLTVISIVLVQGIPAYGTALYALGLGMAGLSSWCWILAFLGFAMNHLNHRAPALEYANEAVLPYILHQSVLICAGYFIVQWPIPDLLKWGIILGSSFVLIMALYEGLIRRVPLLRVLFGMKAAGRRPGARLEPRTVEPQALPQV